MVLAVRCKDACWCPSASELTLRGAAKMQPASHPHLAAGLLVAVKKPKRNRRAEVVVATGDVFLPASIWLRLLTLYFPMKFFTWFAIATIAILLLARFMPKTPAEPIIPTEAKEAQGSAEGDNNAPPARTEEQGRRDAQQGGTTLVVPGFQATMA